MALPMDEQRILEEMERMLAADDPRLAARLAAFGQPSVATVLRSRRARAALSLLMLAVIGAAAAVIYLVSAFRLGTSDPSVPLRHHTSHHQTSTLPARLSAPLPGPVPGPVQCAVQITPHACASWSPVASGSTQHPGGGPGVTGAQGTGDGHTAHPARSAKS